jgi:hypothetical protein
VDHLLGYNDVMVDASTRNKTRLVLGLDNRTVWSDFGWKMQIRVTTAGGKMKPTAVHLLQRLVRVTGYSDAGLVGRFARFQETKESSARR